MKKKRIVSVILVSIVFLAVAVITSCSSEFADEMIDNSPTREQDRIEELAKEYGLKVKVRDDILATRAGSEQDIENEFAMMASLLGDYEILGEQNGDTIVLRGLGNNLFSISGIPSNFETTGNTDLTTFEYGHASDSGIEFQYCFEIKVSLRWNLTNNYSAEITNATVTELMGGGATIIPTISNEHVYIIGSQPTIMFSCDLNMSGYNGVYYYSVSGDYCITTGIGSLQII